MAEHERADPSAVQVDDALVEELGAGTRSPADYLALAMLAALRDDVQFDEVEPSPIFRQLADERLFDLPAETVGQEPATTMLPVYPPTFTPVSPAPSGFEKDDGSWYARIDPELFDSYDEVDSRTIVDHGAPP